MNIQQLGYLLKVVSSRWFNQCAISILVSNLVVLVDDVEVVLAVSLVIFVMDMVWNYYYMLLLLEL